MRAQAINWCTGLIVLSALVVAGCPGSLENPERFTSAGAGSNVNCMENLMAAKCATSGCHTQLDLEQNLDLQSPDLASRLVGVPATGTGCSGDLVVAGDPDSSILYGKLQLNVPCGSRMPFAMTPLSDSQISCVRNWIISLGDDGGTAEGGGSDAGPSPEASNNDDGGGGGDDGGSTSVDASSDGGASSADAKSDGPAVGTGTGLRGEYFDNDDFTASKLVRTDATVDVDWAGGESPDSSIATDDTFSIVWTGKVKAAYGETYTFFTNADDGARLTVNGQKLVDDFTAHGLTEHSGTITLTAGQSYDIKLEYYNSGNAGGIHLSWSSSSQAKQIIPKSQLTPAP